jgi:hypothetical protein
VSTAQKSTRNKLNTSVQVKKATKRTKTLSLDTHQTILGDDIKKYYTPSAIIDVSGL